MSPVEMARSLSSLQKAPSSFAKLRFKLDIVAFHSLGSVEDPEANDERVSEKGASRKDM
jgi:hypothetical protein